MNEKQQQLTFEKGITNVPSDALCSDNALAESIGLVYENGEHRVIQKPAEFMTSITSGRKVLYIHKYDNQERYITKSKSGTTTTVYWGRNVAKAYTENLVSLLTLSDGADVIDITSIGKTLIINCTNGIYYFIWRQGLYLQLGDIPELEIEFRMSYVNEDTHNVIGYNVVRGEKDTTGIINTAEESIVENGQQRYNDFIVGFYSENLKKVAHEKGFAQPFFARAALKMYDGTYTRITNPVLLYPSVTKNTFGYVAQTDVLTLTTRYSNLYYRLYTDYSSYSDIIKEVVLFVSDGVSIYDTIIDQKYIPYPTSTECTNGIVYEANSGRNKYLETLTDAVTTGYYKVLSERNDTAIIGDLSNVSVFYKLCSLELSDTNSWGNTTSLIDTNTIENITTQEQLSEDDYFSNSKLKPGFTYAYNSRLNIASVSRTMFSGFSYFMPYDQATAITPSYTTYVRIKTESGDRVVVNEYDTDQIQGWWFYYPDSRADRVTIMNGNTVIVNVELKEHPGLNGAYYIKQELPHQDLASGAISKGNPIVAGDVNTNDEILPNYIIQSEVNNPWVFKAEGYFKVSTGKIIGVSSLTQALSQGQFGQYPLLVFSTEGIWALSVGTTGYYTAIHPMSREVALEDNPCITQVDGAVFFASKKGLMLIVGSQVKCVSEQLNGKENKFFDGHYNNYYGKFNEYLKNAFIAYDYRDSLLWLFDGVISTCYVYSIKSGTFSKYDFGVNIVTNVVNNYPDYLLQAGTVAYTLTGRPDINLDGTGSGAGFTPYKYNATMLSRPMKLENAFALKSIMQVKHVTDFASDTYIYTENSETVTANTLQMRIFASNNLKNWVELTSLRGTPWKYYRFMYDFRELIATDRFAGTIIVTQERRTDKLR